MSEATLCLGSQQNPGLPSNSIEPWLPSSQTWEGGCEAVSGCVFLDTHGQS